MIFVVNCGSSTVKWAAFEDGERIAGGTEEGDHEAALRAALAGRSPSVVAHRVVHGGDRFSAPVLIDDEVLAAIDALGEIAPLHNPVNARGIAVARDLLPDVPHVAVFDTAFHATLPEEAHTYAVPREWNVRRYGFHGTSHAYVSREAARHLGREDANVIVLHLGNGASATAVEAGRAVDTSMGFTPLEGLVMGTRSGDVDPGVLLHMLGTLTREELDRGLNRESGMLALAGTNDLREIGDGLALDVYCRRIKKYVGAYYAVLGRVDAIVFTAGVGENDARVRARSLAGLERLGIAVDPARNEAGDTVISPEGAEVAVLVIGTDEEREMAAQAAHVVSTQP